jgi:hypothetical protein
MAIKNIADLQQYVGKLPAPPKQQAAVNVLHSLGGLLADDTGVTGWLRAIWTDIAILATASGYPIDESLMTMSQGVPKSKAHAFVRIGQAIGHLSAHLGNTDVEDFRFTRDDWRALLSAILEAQYVLASDFSIQKGFDEPK